MRDGPNDAEHVVYALVWVFFFPFIFFGYNYYFITDIGSNIQNMQQGEAATTKQPQTTHLVLFGI